MVIRGVRRSPRVGERVGGVESGRRRKRGPETKSLDWQKRHADIYIFYINNIYVNRNNKPAYGKIQLYMNIEIYI